MTQNSKRMLLLSCCAPCSVRVIHALAKQQTDFSVLFFNPNIRPESEYIKRRDENKRVCAHYDIPFIELPYDTTAWDCITQGLENEPERGRRCDKCFELRLMRTAEYAKSNGYTTFSSVLGISRYKDFDQVNRAAQIAETTHHIIYDTTNWRTLLPELQKTLEEEFSLYKQKYCGCKPRA